MSNGFWYLHFIYTTVLGHCLIAILMVFFDYFIQPLREILSSVRFREWGVGSGEWGEMINLGDF
jgi:hypothetical protein